MLTVWISLSNSAERSDSAAKNKIMISEVELLEPHLYMSANPLCSDMLAQAVHRRIFA